MLFYQMTPSISSDFLRGSPWETKRSDDLSEARLLLLQPIRRWARALSSSGRLITTNYEKVYTLVSDTYLHIRVPIITCFYASCIHKLKTQETNLPNKNDIITRKMRTLFDKELPITCRRHDLFCLVTRYFPMVPAVNKNTTTKK